MADVPCPYFTRTRHTPCCTFNCVRKVAVIYPLSPLNEMMTHQSEDLDQGTLPFTYQKIDIPQPKCAQRLLCISFTGDTPFRSLRNRPLKQSPNNKDIWGFTPSLHRKILHICVERSLQAEHKLSRKHQVDRTMLTRESSEGSRRSYALTARERSFEAETSTDSYSVAGLYAVVNEEYD